MKPSEFESYKTENIELGKTFKLYSPKNIIPNPFKPKTYNKQDDKKVIQLVFSHPNLLFIHPNKLIDQKEKQDLIEYNIVKKIVDRKKLNTSFKSKQFQKPSTAPTCCYRSKRRTDFLKLNTEEKQDKINIYNLQCEKQGSENPQTRKLKAYTSNSKFRKTFAVSTKENFWDEKTQTRTSALFQKNRNTVQMEFEQKRKKIETKYQNDKTMREKYYSNGMRNSKNQQYILIEKKFSKYLRKN